MADDTTEEPSGEETAAAETAAAEPAPAPVIDPEVAAAFERFEAAFGDGVVDHGDAHGTLVVRVRPDTWRRAAEVSLPASSSAFAIGCQSMPEMNEW